MVCLPVVENVSELRGHLQYMLQYRPLSHIAHIEYGEACTSCDRSGFATRYKLRCVGDTSFTPAPVVSTVVLG